MCHLFRGVEIYALMAWITVFVVYIQKMVQKTICKNVLSRTETRREQMGHMPRAPVNKRAQKEDLIRISVQQQQQKRNNEIWVITSGKN